MYPLTPAITQLLLGRTFDDWSVGRDADAKGSERLDHCGSLVEATACRRVEEGVPQLGPLRHRVGRAPRCRGLLAPRPPIRAGPQAASRWPPTS
jgi:hypothetical protein